MSSRRSFFKNMSLGLIGSVTLPKDKKPNNMTQKTIKNIKPMGFNWETMDPFLFCVHHEDDFPEGNEEMGPKDSLKGRHLGDDFILKDGYRMYHGKKVPGFPGHPHRGFETITIVRKGIVDHTDSLGASGRYGEGDVQWMTAGKGVQHAEMFPLVHQDKKNPLELFQVWLNLPAKSKMTDPFFKMFWGKEIPHHKVNSNAKNIVVEIVAGSFFGYNPPKPPPGSWAADPDNEVGILNVLMEEGSTITIPAASIGINRMVYFYEGEQILLQNEDIIKKYHSVEVEAAHELNITASKGNAKILILQGKPINEQVIQYGPFVMNSKQEIEQAFEDYNRTRFGGWPWPRYDYTHDKSKGRFALYADGSYEEGA